jgi:hypothetical protein
VQPRYEPPARAGAGVQYHPGYWKAPSQPQLQPQLPPPPPHK